MGGIIEIQDLVSNSGENWGDPYTKAIIEDITPAPAGPDRFDHTIAINYEVSYISTFLKWSTVGGTANKVFKDIHNLVAVYNKDGLVYYGNTNLSSSNTLINLVDEEVYQVVKSRGSRPSSLSLKGGEKVLENGEAGFSFTFATGTDNWFPWCIDKHRNITLTVRRDRNKISLIEDSAGRQWTEQGALNNTNTLQFFEPGKGYIITVTESFTLTVLEREDRSPILIEEYPVYAPVFDTGEVNADIKLPHLEATISVGTLKNAISQFPIHSGIVALKQSEIDRYKSSNTGIPGHAAIKTFYDDRGLDVTFNTLMKIDQTYSQGNSFVYNRIDFQTDYNTKIKNLEQRTINYKFEFTNFENHVIGGGNIITALKLKSLGDDEEFIFKVTNPNTKFSQTINFVITAQTVERKFVVGNFRGSSSLIHKLYKDSGNFKYVTVDNKHPYEIVDWYDIKWVENEKMKITQLYCTNHT